MNSQQNRTLVAASEQEINSLQELEQALNTGDTARVVIGEGTPIPLTSSVLAALREVARQLAQGHAISIIPTQRELTTQEAADLLQISRPFLIRLLDAGEISYTYVGTHRRLSLDEVMRYRAKRMAKQKQTLDELLQMCQDEGAYD